MYGDEWNYEDITSFELMEKLPEVTVRSNEVVINRSLKNGMSD
jgi:hypothetical protein